MPDSRKSSRRPLRILITGASRGIGLEMARQSLDRGDQVMAACRNPAGAGELAALAGQHAGLASVLEMDVSSDESVRRAAQRTEAGIDILVANAGILDTWGGLGDDAHTQDSIRESLMTNIAGVFFTARHFLPHLRAGVEDRAGTNGAAMPGRVAVISSQMGSSLNSGANAPIYRATKAAATNLARSMARELLQEGIAVGAFHPGWVQTDMGGSEAAVHPRDSAAGLLTRFDALGLGTSGVFEDYRGEAIPF